MDDIDKSNDDSSKIKSDAKPKLDPALDEKSAKGYQENFTSFSHDAVNTVSEFSIEDAETGKAVTARGIKRADVADNKNSETPTPDAIDFISAKADEIMNAAGTFKIPGPDEIAIAGRVYNKTDVIAHTGDVRPKSAEETRLKELREKIAKGPTLQFFGEISETYRKHIDHWWSTVPESYKQTMKQNGIHVVVAETANAIYPNADKMLARGHHGASLATTGGMYAPDVKSVVMVEHPTTSKSAKDTNDRLKEKGIEKLGWTQWEIVKKAWHELGHGLDYHALDHIALSKNYGDAYEEGLKRLTDRDRKNWDYFLSRDPHASKGHENDKPQEEMLAELFALAHVPQRDLRGSEIRMLEVFKEVVDLLRTKHIMPPKN